MKKLLILLFFILIFGSCTTNYFLCETAGPVKLYASPNTNSTYIEVPVGKNLISTGKYKKYRRAKYGNKRGYVYKTRFLSEKKIRSLSDWNFDSEHLHINIRILIMHLVIQQNISISQHQLVVLSKLKDTIERMELMLSHIQEELLLGENNKLNI